MFIVKPEYETKREPLFMLNAQGAVPRNPFYFGKIPLFITKRTHGARFEPSLNTIQMKDVAAISKGNAESIVVGGRWIGLVLNGRFVETVAANGTRIGANIPTPHGHGTPFLDFETRRSAFGGFFLGLQKSYIKETKPVSESVLPKMYGSTFIPFRYFFPIQSCRTCSPAGASAIATSAMVFTVSSGGFKERERDGMYESINHNHTDGLINERLKMILCFCGFLNAKAKTDKVKSAKKKI